MKLKIYSVAEKKPPVDETILLWEIDNEGNILNVEEAIANVSIPHDDEIHLVPTGVIKDMVWQTDLAIEMRYDDLWSYSIVEKGE